jgi:hypothetical protein
MMLKTMQTNVSGLKNILEIRKVFSLKIFNDLIIIKIKHETSNHSSLFLAFLLAFNFIACKNEEKKEEPAKTDATKTEPLLQLHMMQPWIL